jgi:O-antigen/teichoic acid export membrane protein
MSEANSRSALIRNSAWSLLDVFAVSLIGFLINVILARILGPTGLGSYSFLVTLGALITAVSSGGIGVFLIRESVKKPWKRDHYINSAISLFIVYSLPICTFFALVSSLIFPAEDRFNFCLAIIFQYLMVLFGFAIMFFISIGKSKVSTILNIIFKVLLCGSLILMMMHQENIQVVNVLLVTCFVIGLMTITAAYVYTVLGEAVVKFTVKPKTYKLYILASYPILGASLAEFINLKVDTLMLGAIRGNMELGFYTAAYSLYVGFTLVALALTKVFNPVFTRIVMESKKRALQLLKKYIIMNICYSFIILVSLFFFGEALISVAFGQDYSQSSAILFYLGFALPFINLNRLFNYSIIAIGGQTSFFWYTLIGTGLNITINAALIPNYGAVGAVIATGVTELAVLVLGGLYLFRFFFTEKSN